MFTEHLLDKSVKAELFSWIMIGYLLVHIDKPSLFPIHDTLFLPKRNNYSGLVVAMKTKKANINIQLKRCFKSLFIKCAFCLFLAIERHAEGCKLNLMRQKVFDFKDDPDGVIMDTARVYIRVKSKTRGEDLYPNLINEQETWYDLAFLHGQIHNKNSHIQNKARSCSTRSSIMKAQARNENGCK